MQNLTPILDQLRSEVCEHGRIASIECWQCCETCNHDDHLCRFCGDALRHDGTLFRSGEINPCYWDPSVGTEAEWIGRARLMELRGMRVIPRDPRPVVDLRE